MKKWMLGGIFLALLLTACAAEVPAPEITLPEPPPAVLEAEPAPEPEPEVETEPEIIQEPEPTLPDWFRPVADEVFLPNGDASVFDAYVSEHPEWTADPAQLYREADGRIVWKNRDASCGILPGTVEAIVYDPATGEITERVSAWCRQGGWTGETVTLHAPKSGFQLTVPAFAADYFTVETLPPLASEDMDNPEYLFCCSIPSEHGGRVMQIYRMPIEEYAAWRPQLYPDWSSGSIGPEIYEMGRDDRYVYILDRPSGMEFDPQDPEEAPAYEPLAQCTELIAAGFLWENGLLANPNNVQNAEPDSLWPVDMVHFFQVEGDRLICRMRPSIDSGGEPDHHSWQWRFEVETADGAQVVTPPNKAWGNSQRYEIDLSPFTSFRAVLYLYYGTVEIPITILE